LLTSGGLGDMEKRRKVTLILQIFVYTLVAAFALYFLFMMFWGIFGGAVLVKNAEKRIMEKEFAPSTPQYFVSML
jgi:hypothetical protein